LKPLFITAQNYIETYAPDIFWLERQLEKSYNLRANSESLTNTADIHNGSLTVKLFDTIVERDYRVNSETDKPWFKPELNAQLREPGNPESKIDLLHIGIKPIRHELEILAGAAIFILLCFTGMRHGEIVCLLASALRIDGRLLNCQGDLFAQVEEGKEFELSRTVFKLIPSPSGKTHVTPLPKIAAVAFVVLVKLFQKGRTLSRVRDSRGNYLLPAGGLVPLWREKAQGVAGRRYFMKTIAPYLRTFCSAAGVDAHHPHQCRKTLATLFINEDPESLELIRWLLAHKSIAMTVEYIMSLPGVNSEIAEYHKVHSSEKLIYFVAEALDGYAAGAAGNRAEDALLINPESWKGQMLPYNMKVLIQSYEAANFTLHRTPAAWCIRFPTRVPRFAPCLPPTIQAAIENGEISDGMTIHPRPEHCVPWLCGDAGHTRDDLENVDRSLRFGRQQASKASNAKERAHYEQQVTYWEDVMHQLQYGREDIGSHKFIESFMTSVC